MLLKFQIENFLSFKKTTVLDLEAHSIRELPENTFSVSTASLETKVLKSVALYGANSSGKSNLLKAFKFMRNFVLTSSSESKSYQNIKVEPYRLDPEYEQKPSLFEVTLVLDGTKYRYGFVLSSKSIIKEWLYFTEKRKEERLFNRIEQVFEIEKRLKTEAEGSTLMLSKITRENALFLSVLEQFNSVLARKILSWFDKSIIVFDSINQDTVNFVGELLKEAYYKRRITDIINATDLGFSSIEAEIKEKVQRTGFAEGFITALYQNNADYRIKTHHTKHINNRVAGNIYFDLQTDESIGSQKFVLLLGPLLKALKESAIIWIDELDARLHSNLLLFVLKFYNSNLNNSKGSQLIYTSHNTIVLKKDLRRDQMVFVRRDKYQGSIITSLHDWDSKVRSDASFDKDYLEGKYKAIPKIDLSPDLFD